MRRQRFKPNENFEYYLKWIVERQKIFWRRQDGAHPPYTDDPIMARFKFTNVYRILDRTTQYLMRNVIYNGIGYSARGMFWRILIFKHFNRPTTWEYLIRRLGDIDEETDFEDIIKVLNHYHKFGGQIYSNAYMLTASFMRNSKILKKFGIKVGDSKHDAYFRIFQQDILERQIDIRVLNADSFGEVFDTLSSVLTIGPFLAYQYTVDLNYSPLFTFDENDFVAIGPGTKRGIDRTFSFQKKPDYEAVLDWLEPNLGSLLHRYGLINKFKPLPGHWPTKTDLLNCFCETDKYLRALGVETEGKQIHGKRMKNPFRPNRDRIDYMFPPDWKIHDTINKF